MMVRTLFFLCLLATNVTHSIEIIFGEELEQHRVSTTLKWHPDNEKRIKNVDAQGVAYTVTAHKTSDGQQTFSVAPYPSITSKPSNGRELLPYKKNTGIYSLDISVNDPFKCPHRNFRLSLPCDLVLAKNTHSLLTTQLFLAHTSMQLFISSDMAWGLRVFTSCALQKIIVAPWENLSGRPPEHPDLATSDDVPLQILCNLDAVLSS